MESLILWCLGVYFVFHVLARSDILVRPRNWLVKVLPSWMTYPLGCAFCFSFHVGWMVTLLVLITTGWFILDFARLLVAPVINLIVDLCVRALMRANETPVVTTTVSTTQAGDRTVRFPAVGEGFYANATFKWTPHLWDELPS